ncbi:MAG: LD-carboxypeptidase [Chlorobiota bacterium]|nr:LD-carboxypeptidase [Chlorobiota bacterium]QQS67404.1 MAG: LD-carboxypeptidase [Chlorobiota bacterium]
MKEEFIKPKKIKKGECIGIVSPSSPQKDETRLLNGVKYFESLGYNVILGKNVFNRYGYLAGSDLERASDINDMINNPLVKMIIAGRGGYGVTRILDKIDYKSLRKNPKIIIGFSDITALNFAISKKCKLVNFTGAMPGVDFWDLENIPTMTEDYFWRCITSTKPLGVIKQNIEMKTRKKGETIGKLFAGNLTLIASICGSKYFPNLKNQLLLIEEIGEEPYRVDRLLSQLFNSNHLKNLSGLLLGEFTDAKPLKISVESLSIDDVINHYANKFNLPCISNVEYGHIYPKLTLPIGVKSSLNATKCIFSILENSVE